MPDIGQTIMKYQFMLITTILSPATVNAAIQIVHKVSKSWNISDVYLTHSTTKIHLVFFGNIILYDWYYAVP